MKIRERKRAGLAAFLSMALILSPTSPALAARKLTLDEAQKIADQSDKEGGFPIAINESVLAELNYFTSTKSGRRFIRESLQRIQEYRPLLEPKFNQYQIPLEMLAIGVIESGFRNLPQIPNKSLGAGIWMFIRGTARKFGLQVDSKVDERLDVEAETEAAVKYLSLNYKRFKDWPLAILSYNVGEGRVEDAIEKANSRDAWSLIDAGLPQDKNYLAKVMAVALILKNPQTVQKK